MSAKNLIDSYVSDGIEFEAVPYVLELFPAPLPTEVFGQPIDAILDLSMTSGHFGFSEVFLPDITTCETINACVAGNKISFTIVEFISWQLCRASAKTLFWLNSKTEAGVDKLLDHGSKAAGDGSCYPEDLLYPYGKSTVDLQHGYAVIERLFQEKQSELVDTLVTAMLDEQTGVFAFGETLVRDDNLSDVRVMYANWKVPILVLEAGTFRPYIKAGDGSALMREEFDVRHFIVRNYDEGEVT